MSMNNELADKTIFNSRLIAASPKKIFRAFAEAEHLQNWWGPKGFTNTFSVFEFTNGGNWEFVMRSPDGKEYPNKSTFLELIEAKKVVVQHVAMPHFVLTITLDEEEGKTRIGWLMVFETAEVRDAVSKYAVDANEQNFDRLENELARMG